MLFEFLFVTLRHTRMDKINDYDSRVQYREFFSP